MALIKCPDCGVDEATREAQEAKERANEAQENLAILESILGID